MYSWRSISTSFLTWSILQFANQTEPKQKSNPKTKNPIIKTLVLSEKEILFSLTNLISFGTSTVFIKLESISTSLARAFISFCASPSNLTLKSLKSLNFDFRAEISERKSSAFFFSSVSILSNSFSSFMNSSLLLIV